MPPKRQKTSAVTVYTRVKEYKDIFHVDNGLFFCNYCDLSVEWKHKSTIDAHCTSKKHLSQQKLYIANERNKNQQTLRKDGTISQAPTLCQIYLFRVFNKHLESLKTIFDLKPISIIMDETSDNCARSVVNTLFVFHTHIKLVSVNFLEQVNNSTIGQTLLPILTFYNIPLNLSCLFLSDSAAYMKKCYRNVLKPIILQLIHLPCIAHILNLIGETWRDFSQFSLLKTFLAKIKDSFVKSPARKARYITHLRMNEVALPYKIPLSNKTHWNS
ncbi:hypothetical protein Glove_116g6 [Diversispora epigaea]|uniref:DUF659 domain-containing protein n=1 Tax=Diversispora epigaea TaxID=1348612 RepID=A0A397J3G7_9GLOM|nr:hypothetical protein Glove_116g6 [Diversispora epigaea]